TPIVLARAVIAVTLVSSCSSDLMLRGSTDVRPTTIDGRGTTIPLPRVLETTSASLGDGWPVWLVRHDSGSVTVISAVAPPRVRSATSLFAGQSALVRWLPASRRFVADDIVYDDYGRVLGYGADDRCLDGCPRIVETAPDERDLDTFAAAVTGNGLRVYESRRSPAKPEAYRWVDWDHPEHVDHELDTRDDERWPAAPTTIADVLAHPLGTYALVTGAIVQSTTDAPRLCGCGTCDASWPLALGVAAVAVSHPAVHSESGTMLVRRDASGVAIIASSHAGACGAMRM
ncbi:MAG TPA: hypothetical protein VGO00_27400, partial [Kofleriaceae bacterium]|nr:hypothetical protein [Kofleriaceae bacterium]